MAGKDSAALIACEYRLLDHASAAAAWNYLVNGQYNKQKAEGFPRREALRLFLPLNKCGSGALRIFYAGNALFELEKVFPRFRAFSDAESPANRS